ncbi:MAG TPA: dCTP deaminase [Phycisphaerae bacterium]|nr:dCTP deaminase [Phycisphaerae bacterium]
MSTLTGKRIRKLLDDGRLIITPLLSPKQIGTASVDVRLGNQFIVFRTHILGVFNPYKMEAGQLRRLQERQVVGFRRDFILHPGMLALGSTFEYVSMPNDLECQVEGRSSWARLGIQIATASSVEPGFKGVLTLELSNLGTIPVSLWPGVRIAQLVFHTAEPPLSKRSGGRKYDSAVGPEFSRLFEDEDGRVFEPPG